MNTEIVALVRQAEKVAHQRTIVANYEAEKMVEAARAEAMEKYDEAFDLTHKQLIEGTFRAERDSVTFMEKEIEDGRQKIAVTIQAAQKNVEAALNIVIGELVAK